MIWNFLVGFRESVRLYSWKTGAVSHSSSTTQDHPAACLRRFQASRDAEAFREIVGCYGGLVEGTARRLLDGDAESARDVAQQVFIDLAKAAPGLRAESQLGGWLHQHTVFVASHHRQAESRRRRREQVAAERMQEGAVTGAEADRVANVHRALTKLPESDRAVLVLRYWENKKRQDGWAFP
jgi:RNA polymerase sigma factor (sigma-70 family)